MSEENRDNFKTYMVKEKDFTNLIIKDKEDNYYYSAIYVNELQQEIERLNNIINELEKHFEFLKMNSTGGNKEFMEDILDFIKALKGSDKE